ncbi:Gfo/Idh/MocA family oxidoreductase [Vibrio sp. Of7-15]|uniref:Gfo/Idh/MocA family protein n=1 Tax=Vibrio sp. Of7-15 TaxID=2724879 RepID=UPI001EF2FDB5|nr:Gfo/Idh/MocA family oxidoreductase [Vibrio sp. Of7-15]MCG7499588.1 Gfo/Idh/MocA family oxidoreductase [Vibrio sp. Of7-15]
MINNTHQPIRWGIIGCGAVTELKSGPAYQKTEGFELAAVMRRSHDKAQDYAKRHKVPAFYTDADDLINSEDIDAIYIATPPDSHKYYALKVAKAGKPCCIEKPLAPNYEDSKDIVTAFKKAEQPLFVAYYRRSLPRFNQIKQILESGSIGKVRHISWHLSKPANDMDLSEQYNWRTDSNIAAGGYFDDLASHGLDLFAYLLGDFDSVQGIGLNQQGLYSALDAISACWSHKSGVTGVGSWNFGCSRRQDKVEIMGSEGQVSFSVFDEQPIRLHREGEEEKLFYIENPENIQLFHVANMYTQLAEGGAHPSSGKSALHTSWVMDKILGKV